MKIAKTASSNTLKLKQRRENSMLKIKNNFGSLEHTKTFASNVNIKNNSMIYESLDMNEIFKEK